MMRDRDPETIPAAVEARRLANELEELRETGDGDSMWVQGQADHLRRLTGWSFDVDQGAWHFEDIIPDRPGARAYPSNRNDYVTDDFENWWKTHGILQPTYPRVGLEGFGS